MTSRGGSALFSRLLVYGCSARHRVLDRGNIVRVQPFSGASVEKCIESQGPLTLENVNSTSQEVVIALGGNVGDRVHNFNRALELIREAGIQITGHASLYESAPAYVTDQPRFLNSAVKTTTNLDPHSLLQVLKKIERDMGRRDGGIQFGPRPIDLDIIFYGSSTVNTEHLQIPHPRFTERPFVVAPVMDLLGSELSKTNSDHWSMHPSLIGGLEGVWRSIRGEEAFGKGDLTRVLPIGGTLWDWSKKTHIMGILNATPDSFSDGGKYMNVDKAVSRVRAMALEGADFIDIGAQSTRPNATRLSPEEELDRLIPVLESIKELPEMAGIFLSVDTFYSTVARQAVAQGAQLVNDVSGGTLDSSMWKTVAELGVPYVAMHMRGTPISMQSEENTRYDNVCSVVAEELGSRMKQAELAGIPAWSIITDPGLGFAKTVEHNLELMKQLPTFRKELARRSRAASNAPLMLGPSRKSFLGKILGRATGEDADFATAAAAVAGVVGGANIVRVHAVQGISDALLVADALFR